MSRETCLKIEHNVVKTPKPALLEFLQVSIGYHAQDCVTEIGRSQAGVQFLGLATALLATMDDYRAALAIQGMIVDTAADKTLVPTVRQVQQLLASVQPRCHKAGFMTEVTGWQSLLERSSHSFMTGAQKPSEFPNTLGIQHAVNAFRQLHRIGNADISHATLRIPKGVAAWTISFVKWCLGIPPSVIFDDGTPLLEHEGSTVSVVITDGENDTDFNVTIYSTVESPCELVSPRLWDGSNNRQMGMVEIPSYGRLMWRNANFYDEGDGLAKRALNQAIPYALRQILEHLVFIDHPIVDPSDIVDTEVGSISGPEKAALESRLMPFGEDSAVCEAYSMLFGVPIPSNLRSLDEGLLISDLPLMKIYLAQIRQRCDCNRCSSKESYFCWLEVFWDNLCPILVTILGVSLFHDPETLMLWTASSDSSSLSEGDDTLKAVKLILTKGGYARSPIASLKRLALNLVGHDTSLDLDFSTFVLSCYKGQAIWPTIHQTYKCSKRGFFSLSWLPGNLLYDNETYKLIRGNKSERIPRGDDAIADLGSESVVKPRNLCPPRLRVLWSITAEEGGILQAYLGMQGFLTSFVCLQADMVERFLTKAVMVENCGHRPAAELSTPDLFAVFAGPLDPKLHKDAGNDVVRVIAVDGRNDLRYFTLQALEYRGPTSDRFVLRRAACLSCCLDACRKHGCKYLIL